MKTIRIDHPLYPDGILVTLQKVPMYVDSFHRVLEGYSKQLPSTEGFLNITHPKVSELWGENILRINPPYSIAKEYIDLFIGLIIVKKS